MTGTTNLPIASALEDATPGTIVDLPIPGAWVYVPRVFGDDRGSFHEWFRAEQFTEHLGYPFQVAQANLSHSLRGVIRGIHLADVPPGQAKLVTCVAGEIQDVLVDLRAGSPTFGKHVSILLSDAQPFIIHVPVGVGHGFAALSDSATVNYLVSEAYNSENEWEIHPFDEDLKVEWMVSSASGILSDKDRCAPVLKDVGDRLPQYREARGWEQELRREWNMAISESDEWEGE